MELCIWNIIWGEAVQVDPDNYVPAQVKAQVKQQLFNSDIENLDNVSRLLNLFSVVLMTNEV